MKKIFTLSLLAFAFVLGSFSGVAQKLDMEKVYLDSKKTAYSIAEEINLDEDERLLLVRQITAREQSIAKVKFNQKQSKTEIDYNKYVEQANVEFKRNVADLFGEEKAKRIISLYEF
ncbi:hypothetical protein [Psychroflexus planctonicus]|uniref:DUF4168 domain-containing protein n=1 Tax=Psychroflexus planctonicus TaxID=1526575 RepID=A0ABQ1SJ50_9FLAO|nr:hypothetical protein [Psychroflexus planctonicus]GGE42018.1 hypothetical protein GCM10010832_22550 [Psychroflexus planctonicus]